MRANQINGMKVFLFTVLELLSQGMEESNDSIEDAMKSGIATKLYNRYKDSFDINGFDKSNLADIDKFYRNLAGVLDGNELRKYSCDNGSGLSLIIALALDDVF